VKLADEDVVRKQRFSLERGLQVDEPPVMGSAYVGEWTKCAQLSSKGWSEFVVKPRGRKARPRPK
jgi:hypothetical protein